MKLLFVSLILLSSLFSQALSTVSLPSGKIDIENFPIQYIFDNSNKLGIEELLEREFLETRSREALGYNKKGTLWVRFTIVNPEKIDREVLIYHKEAYRSHEISFHEVENRQVKRSADFSKTEDVHLREIQDASPTYPVIIKAESSLTIYIKNRSTSSFLTNIQLLDKEVHQAVHIQKNVFYAILLGILIALGLYNALLFISIKHSEYLYYVLFTLGSIAYLSYLSGMILEYVILSQAAYKSLLFGVSILQMALITFTKKVLETKEHLPRVHTYLTVLTFLPFSLLIVGIFFGIDKTLPLQASVALLAAVSLIIIGFIAFKYKIPTAKFYLPPVGLYLLFAIIGIFTYFGFFPYNALTYNAFFFASLSEGFLLSFLLSSRIGILRQRAIESEQKLNSEIRSRNEVLNFRVQERTQELHDLNISLESRIDLAVSEIRKKDENLLRQSRMAMMGEMLSMIAHQWRQPLATIVSIKNTIELELTLNVLDPKELQEKLNDIDRYAQYMSKTVSDFSGFFKPNKQKKAFYLTELMETSLLMMKTSYEEHNISIMTNFNGPSQIMSFKNEILQVILNILKNAQDIFSDSKITNPFMHIKLEEFSDRQELSFLDNAGGIPESIIENIFDPYFSTKEEKNGTGLGLYMSRTIIKEHCAGKIKASNKDNGALFTIVLYFDTPDQTAQE